MELVEVSRGQHRVASQLRIAKRGQTRRVELLAEVEAQMGEGIRRQL
jgi:hypothetical protein